MSAEPGQTPGSEPGDRKDRVRRSWVCSRARWCWGRARGERGIRVRRREPCPGRDETTWSRAFVGAAALNRPAPDGGSQRRGARVMVAPRRYLLKLRGTAIQMVIGARKNWPVRCTVECRDHPKSGHSPFEMWFGLGRQSGGFSAIWRPASLDRPTKDLAARGGAPSLRTRVLTGTRVRTPCSTISWRPTTRCAPAVRSRTATTWAGRCSGTTTSAGCWRTTRR